MIPRDQLSPAEKFLLDSLSSVYVDITEAGATSDRDEAARLLRRARGELILGFRDLVERLEGERTEARRVAAELAAVRDQLQAIGRKAFWASKGG